MSDTIRTHLEAILTETTITVVQQPSVATLSHIQNHAVAALELLNNAERSYGNGTRPDDIYRLVPDTESAT